MRYITLEEIIEVNLTPYLLAKLTDGKQRQQPVKYADGRQDVIGVTSALIIQCEGRETTEDAVVTGDEVLIGQVVLEKLDLLVDCKNQKLMPNPANPDYPLTYIL